MCVSLFVERSFSVASIAARRPATVDTASPAGSTVSYPLLGNGRYYMHLYFDKTTFTKVQVQNIGKDHHRD